MAKSDSNTRKAAEAKHGRSRVKSFPLPTGLEMKETITITINALRFYALKLHSDFQKLKGDPLTIDDQLLEALGFAMTDKGEIVDVNLDPWDLEQVVLSTKRLSQWLKAREERSLLRDIQLH